MSYRSLSPILASCIAACVGVSGCPQPKEERRQAVAKPSPTTKKREGTTEGAAAQRRAARMSKLLGRLPRASSPGFSAQQAARLIALSMHCSEREYPNKPSNVVASAADVRSPRQLHPAFFGCYDWHSAVHGHWAMVRVLARYPELTEAKQIRRILDAHLAPKPLAVELAYFRAKHHRLYERPYGWAWYLRLVDELHQLATTSARPDALAAGRWAKALEPLERLLVTRTIDYLKRLSSPVRAGTHASTAFALAHMLDYARARPRPKLVAAIEAAARRFYLGDRRCPAAYEPSGEDFISPCLAEADLMRRVLEPRELASWLDGFFPALDGPGFATLRRPPEVRDLKDPRIGHLIGLSLQRAWCFAGLAKALPKDPRRPVFERLAAIHDAAAAKQLHASGYGGSHWLASFAIFLRSGRAE
jgi:hypothetical protein